jgi:hypothetical protein
MERRTLLRSVGISGRGRKARWLHGTLGLIRHVKRAPDRSLWLTTGNDGGRDKVVRATVG